MIYVPDLFGSYVKGEQQAVQDNWNDLKNYEDVERARTANDAANLQLQLDQWGFGNQVLKSDAEGAQAYVDQQTTLAGGKGKVLGAQMESDMTGMQANAFYSYAPQIQQVAGDTVGTYLNVLDVQNQGRGVQANIDRSLLPQTAGAYYVTKDGQIKEAVLGANIADATRPYRFDTAVLGSATQATAADTQYQTTAYDNQYLLPDKLQNMTKGVQLTGETLDNQLVEARSYTDQKALAEVQRLRAEADILRARAQELANAGGSQEEINALIQDADRNVAQAQNIATAMEGRNAYGRLIGGDYQNLVSTQPMPVGSHINLPVTRLIGSAADIRAQQEQAAMVAAEQAAAEQAAVDAAVVQAGGTPESPTSGGGAPANTAITQTGIVNPYNPNAGDPYAKGSVHRLRTEDGQVMTGTIIGTVTKSDGDYYMVQLPQGGVAHISRDRMNFLTTGSRNATPNDVVRPGKKAIDYSQWLMPGTPASRPPASQPPRSLVPPRAPTTNLRGGTVEYLLQQNPGGFNR